MYSNEIVKGYFGLEVKEELDDSMLPITKEPTHTGMFHYIRTPKFKVSDENDFAYGEEVYGIYEKDKYVWTSDKYNSKRLYKKEKLALCL